LTIILQDGERRRFPMTMIDYALRDAVHHASHHYGIGYILSNRAASNAAYFAMRDQAQQSRRRSSPLWPR
jgi:hypothetical protein